MDENFFKSNFDWRVYVGKYGDLQKANIDTEEKAWNHAKKNGRKKRENRDVFNGDTELLRLFRNFCITGEIIPIPDKYYHKTSNNLEINKFLKDKRVVVVGPSDHVNDGKLIDSYDVVVRINQGHKLTNISDKYGSRTDILYHCVSQNDNNGGLLDNIDCKFIKFAYPELEKSNYHSFNDGTINDYSKINWKKNMSIVNKSLYLEFENFIDCRPNCGTVAIWDLLQYDIKELYITGFTLFQTPFHDQYKDEKIKEAVNRMNKVGKHDQEKIRKYYQCLFNDIRVKCDKQFESIIKVCRNRNVIRPLHLILYDPDRNNVGHYDELKESLKSVYDNLFTYIDNKSHLLYYNFNIEYVYSIYIYTLKTTTGLKELIRSINIRNTNDIKINFYINGWNETQSEFLDDLHKSFSNVNIIADCNRLFYKKKQRIRYESFKPWFSINPPIINDFIKYNITNELNIGKYCVMWTYYHQLIDNERWLGRNSIDKISNILQKKNIKLLIIRYGTKLNDNDDISIKHNGNNYYIDGKINDINKYISICKNSEFCIIFSPGNFYEFRSASKISHFLYNDIKFVTNLDIDNVNNITCNNFKALNINDLEKIEKVETIQSDIKQSTWINKNFKKILRLLNYSNIIGNENIDIIGNDPTTKKL